MDDRYEAITAKQRKANPAGNSVMCALPHPPSDSPYIEWIFIEKPLLKCREG